MEAGTVNYNISPVCHSFIINLKAAAVGFHAMLGGTASPPGSKLLSTFNSHLPATLLWFNSSAGKKYITKWEKRVSSVE